MCIRDRYFLDRVVRRIFAFEGGGAIRQYEGGYTDYQAACGERIAAEMEASGTASGQERGRGDVYKRQGFRRVWYMRRPT